MDDTDNPHPEQEPEQQNTNPEQPPVTGTGYPEGPPVFPMDEVRRKWRRNVIILVSLGGVIFWLAYFSLIARLTHYTNNSINTRVQSKHVPHGHWSAVINGQPASGLTSISYLCPTCTGRTATHGLSMVFRVGVDDSLWSTRYPVIHFHLSDSVPPVNGVTYPMGVYSTSSQLFGATYQAEPGNYATGSPTEIWRTKNNGTVTINHVDLEAGSVSGTFSFMVYKFNVYTNAATDSISITGSFSQDTIVLHNALRLL